MKWDETIAQECRYGDVASRIFKNCEIIWEKSENDYQGYATILAVDADGKFYHYSWTYGSCSGCDEWEGSCLTGDQIEEEMRRTMSILNNKKELRKYLHLEGKYKKAKVPTANSATNGSIPGMLYMNFGGFSEGFNEMRSAAEEWLQKNKTK